MALPAPVIDQPVVRHGEQPSRELAAHFIARSIVNHRKPQVLSQVIGQRPVARVAIKVAPYAQLMAAIKLADSNPKCNTRGFSE